MEIHQHNIEAVFSLIKAMSEATNRSFDQLNAKIDKINGSIMAHTQQIATLEAHDAVHSANLARIDVERVSCKSDCIKQLEAIRAQTQDGEIDRQVTRQLWKIVAVTTSVAVTIVLGIMEFIIR